MEHEVSGFLEFFSLWRLVQDVKHVTGPFIPNKPRAFLMGCLH